MRARLHSQVHMRYRYFMAVIEIQESTAAALRAQADARDLSLEAFLQRIAEASTPINPTAALPLADLERFIDELATESPVLASTSSRAEIYADHD